MWNDKPRPPGLPDIDWKQVDWKAVLRLREGFLGDQAGRDDYWRNEGDLATYDATFAQRIGWKWDFLLADIARMGWTPGGGRLLDWACGSAIEARRFLSRFGPQCVRSVAIHDRSSIAMDFAAGKLKSAWPELAVSRGATAAEGDTVLVSHVLNELTAGQVDRLVEMLAPAQSILWVEPGTYETSRALIGVRERLRDKFSIVAPCTHQAVCGLLAPENERHWCHHFASAPAAASMDPDWSRFARHAGIDMRSLPLSYMVMDKRGPRIGCDPADPAVPVVPPAFHAYRIIGRPRIYKAYAMVFGCDQTGVRDYRMMKRHCAEEFRLMKKEESDTLQFWRMQDKDVVEVREGYPTTNPSP